MEMTENILINTDVMVVMGFLVLLITGYFLYKLITSPIRSFKFIFKATVILMLGCVAWLGTFYFLLNT